MGTPVYMYAYIKTIYYWSDDGWVDHEDTVYIRYGYFMGGQHFQSEKFEPVGEEHDVYGDGGSMGIICTHDVFGSIAREGKVGFGQCAGYMIKETSVKKGPTVYEQEY